MIVRIMGEGQWVVDPDELLELNQLDQRVETAVADSDPQELQRALTELLAAVREHGAVVPDDLLVESDLVLPAADTSIEQVKALLDSTSEYYGLIPDEREDLPQRFQRDSA